MINATPLAPLALPPTLPPSSCFAPLLPLDAADSHAATALSPAQQEFSSLQAWLSAPRTLQLPLHQVECQQEQKGRALQRLLLQAHLQQRGPGGRGSRPIREPRRPKANSIFPPAPAYSRVESEEHTSELQSLRHLVCRLLLEKKK